MQKFKIVTATVGRVQIMMMYIAHCARILEPDLIAIGKFICFNNKFNLNKMIHFRHILQQVIKMKKKNDEYSFETIAIVLLVTLGPEAQVCMSHLRTKINSMQLC